MVAWLRLRDNFREQHAWLLLPILFAICFIVPNRTGATNFYRLFIVIPVLLCFRPADFRDLWANNAFRWFAVLFGWMSLTLLWDGWSDKDVKLLLRQLNVLALFYLVFLICQFQQHRLPTIINSFLFFGVIGVVLILLDWQGIEHYQTSWHHTESARGVFNHHLEVGWIMAVLTLVALYHWFEAEDSKQLMVYVLLVALLGAVTFLVQARGGYVVLLSGVLLVMLLHPGRRTNVLVITVAIGLLMMLAIFNQELLTLWEKITDRGTAGRMQIWGRGYQMVTASFWNLLLGVGMSASAENGSAEHYHNFFLNHAFYSGLIGLVFYLGLLASLLRKAFSHQGLWLWGVLLLAMQVGFIPDGDRLWVNPSSMILCVLLPMAWIMFWRETGDKESKKENMMKPVLTIKNVIPIASLVLIAGITMIWLSVNTSRPAKLADFSFSEGGTVQGLAHSSPETGVLVVDIEGWPSFVGTKMPVLIAGLERPYPWKYKCEQANQLWRGGRVFLNELIRVSPGVELKNVYRQNAAHIFRLEADAYKNGENLADKLIEAGYVVPKGAEIPWCKDSG